MSRLLGSLALVAIAFGSGCGEPVVGRSPYANTPPTVAPIGDVTIAEDSQGTATVNLTDAESVDVLVVTATSSDPSVIDPNGVVVSGTGATRTITLTPLPNANGTTTITVTVTDDSTYVDPVVLTFVVNVTAVDDPPVITGIADATIDEDTTHGPISFTVTDVDTDLAAVAVTATSSNTTLAPTVTLGGTPATGAYTYTVTPAANEFGATTLTFTAMDATTTVTATATLTVTSVNDAPTITAVSLPDPVNTNEDTQTALLTFVVADVETAEPALAVSGASNDTALANPATGFTFGTSGGNRTLRILPEANAFGTATITLTVDDGSGAANATASLAFTLNVASINDLPTITAIANQTFNEDGNSGAIAFTVTDVEDDLAMTSMTVSASSNDAAIIPNSATYLALASTNRNDRTLTVTSAPNANTFASGSNQPVTITVTVTDSNGGFRTTTFQVTVNPQNDAPVLDPIGNLVVVEDGSGSFTVTFRDPDAATDPNPTAVLDAVAITFMTSDSVVVPANFTEVVASRVTDTTDPANPFQTRTYDVAPQPNAFHGSAPYTTVTVTGTSIGAASAPQAFTIQVTAANDAPTIAIGSPVTTDEDTPTSAIAFTMNDVDNTLTLAGLSITGNSNTTLIPSGNITFGGTDLNPTVQLMPAPNAHGSASITVQIADGVGGTATATFTFTVNAVNDPATIASIVDAAATDVVANGASTNEDTALALTVTFTDADGCTGLTLSGTSTVDALVADAAIAAPSSTTSCTQTVTLTPTTNRNTTLDGTTDITIALNDNANGGSPASTDSATFTLTVVATPDAPVVTNESISGIEGNRTVVSAFSVLTNDTDPDGGTLTASLVSVTHSTTAPVPAPQTTVNSDGTFTFYPEAGYVGDATLTYAVSNGSLSTNGTVTITFGTRMHWYVNDTVAGPGTGTESDPFKDLAAVTTGVQWSAGEDQIHLAYGSGGAYNPVTLDSNCDLLGIPGGVSGTSSPTIAGTTCVSASGTSSISNVTLSGCTTGISAPNLVTSLALANVVVSNSATGVTVAGTSPSAQFASDGLAITGSTTLGLRVQQAAVSFTGTNSVQASSGAGVAFANAAFGGGTTLSSVTVGTSGARSSSGTAVSLASSTGMLTIASLSAFGSGTASGVVVDASQLTLSSSSGVVDVTGTTGSALVVTSGSDLRGRMGSLVCSKSAARCVDLSASSLDFEVVTDFDAATTGNFEAVFAANTSGTRFRVVDGDDGVVSANDAKPAIAFTNVAGLDVVLRRVDRADFNSTAIELAGSGGTFHVQGDASGARNGTGGTVVSGQGSAPAVTVDGLTDVVLRGMNITNTAANGVAVSVLGTSVVDLDGCVVDGGANGAGVRASSNFAGDLTITGSRLTGTEKLLDVTTSGTGISTVTVDTGTARSVFDTAEADGACIAVATSGSHAATVAVSATDFSDCGLVAISASGADASSTLSLAIDDITVAADTNANHAIVFTNADGGGDSLTVNNARFGTTTSHTLEASATNCTGRNVLRLTNNVFGTVNSVSTSSTAGSAVYSSLVGTGCSVAHTFSANTIAGVEAVGQGGLQLSYALDTASVSKISIQNNLIDLTAGAATTNAAALRIASTGARGPCYDVDSNTFDSANPGDDVNASSGTGSAATTFENFATSLLATLNATNSLLHLDVVETAMGFTNGVCPIP